VETFRPVIELAELVLILAILFLRRVDEGKLRTRLSRVAKNQGRLVDLVRSSIHPPPARCRVCEHEHEHHFGPLGQAVGGCKWAHCRCPEWADPGELDFSDVTPSEPERTT
jgi:hypothetical protein